MKIGEAVVAMHPVVELVCTHMLLTTDWNGASFRYYRSSVSADVWHELGGYSADTFVSWDTREAAERAYSAALLTATKKNAGVIHEQRVDPW
jgi:hypothetical protein